MREARARQVLALVHRMAGGTLPEKLGAALRIAGARCGSAHRGKQQRGGE
jgi:hypothetical protein